MNSPLVAMVAGEASGDLLGAHLIAALRRHLPDARFVGIGGPKMQAAGFDAWWPAEKLAVHGYADALRHYREIAGIRRQLLAELLKVKPAVFIGIDAPDFNLWLETRLKEQSVRTVHYVSPSVWAWRRGRIAKIARAADHLLALFPFEPEIYRQTDVAVTYVGHPLADQIDEEVDRQSVRERLGIADAQRVFALLPGSRRGELRYMADTLVATGALILQCRPGSLLLVPLASRETREAFEEALWRAGAQELPFKLLFGHAQDALAACDAALVASGTATLEAALLKTPMAILYRISPWSWRIMRHMGYQPWVGLPNILAGRFVVPEFLQDDATPENLAQALLNLAEDPQLRPRLQRLFASLHRQLRQGTADKAAQAILPYLA
jgi:lipid-A-disaccharide synthase